MDIYAGTVMHALSPVAACHSNLLVLAAWCPEGEAWVPLLYGWQVAHPGFQERLAWMLGEYKRIRFISNNMYAVQIHELMLQMLLHPAWPVGSIGRPAALGKVDIGFVRKDGKLGAPVLLGNSVAKMGTRNIWAIRAKRINVLAVGAQKYILALLETAFIQRSPANGLDAVKISHMRMPNA